MKKRTIIIVITMMLTLLSGLLLSAPSVSSDNVRITSSGETLYYLSTATPAINVSPTALNFGNVNVGSNSTLSITVANVGAGDLTIGAVTSPSAPFSKTTDTCSNQSRPQGTNCTISIQFAPTAGGTFSGSFVIPSNDPTHPSYTITLTGTGIAGPNIVATPNPLDFGTVNVGSASTLTVTVQNTGSQNIVFTSITNPTSPFSRVFGGTCTNTTTLTPSSTCTIRVRFAPTTQNTFSGSFIINSNAANAPAYTISLMGIGRTVPQISISPNPVDFGNVANNTSATRTVTVSSVGSMTLIISSYTSPTAPFSITASTCTANINLAVGSSCTITVRFAPTTLGAHNGSFIVYSNTGDVPGTPTTVNLMGNSTAPPPTCSASFSPSTINAGQSTTLSWSTTNTVSGNYSCTGNIGSGSLSLPSGSATVMPTTTQTCTFTVNNSTGQTGTCSASVTVNSPPPTCSIGFNPASINTGGSTTVSWSTTNAVSGNYSCTGDIGSGSLTPLPSGSVTVMPTITQTCTLTVLNATGQSGSCSASVTVGSATSPPPTCSASFSPSTINAGQTTTLSWSTTNTVSGNYSCTDDIGSGSVPSLPSGSASVMPSVTQTCTFTVNNSTGQTGTCSASVTVNSPSGGGGQVTTCLDSLSALHAPNWYAAFHINGNQIRLVRVNTVNNPTTANITQAGNWINLSSTSGLSCPSGVDQACLIKSGSSLYIRSCTICSNYAGSITPGVGGYTYATACDGQASICSHMGLEANATHMRALCQERYQTQSPATTSTGITIPYSY